MKQIKEILKNLVLIILYGTILTAIVIGIIYLIIKK